MAGRILKSLILFLGGICTPLPLFAASYTWDGGGADGNWTTATNWVGDAAPTGATTNDLIFAGTTRTAATNNLTSGTDFRNLTFESNAGTFTLAGSSRLDLFGSITNLSASLQTISLPVQLSTLNSSHAVDSGSGAGMTISGVISGLTGASLKKLGSSTLTLSGNNSFSGGLDVAEGTLKAGHNGANPSGSGRGDLSISNGAVFDVNGFAASANGLNGAGTILNSASGSNTFTFGYNNAGGTFRGNFTNTGVGALTLTKAGTGTVVLSGQMSGNMGSALTISGGQLTLSNGFANNKSSATELRITGGTLLSQEGASWSGAANSSVSIGYLATTNASLLHVAGGNLDFGGGSFIIGVNAGATGENKFLMTGGSVTQAVNQIRVGANNGGIMEVSGGVVNALAGIQFGSSGAATTWATNAVFRLTGGEVNLNHQSLVLNAGNVPTNLTNQLILGDGTAGSGTLSNFRRFVTTGASAQAEIHFNGAKLVAGTNAGSDFLNALSGMTAWVKTGGLWVDTGTATNDVVIAANLLDGGGNGGLIKTGATTLVLSGSNSYTGATTVQSGVLALSGAGSLSSSTALNLNPSTGTARFVISNMTNGGLTLGSLAGAAGATVDLGSKALTVGGDNSSTMYAGAIINTGSLVKHGTGTFTLRGTNTFSGGTTISAGTLELGNGGSVAGRITNHATLSINRTDSSTLSNVVSGSGALTKSGSGMATLTAANTYSGDTTVHAGVLEVASGGSISSSSATVNNGGTLDVAGAAGHVTINHGGILQGSGTVSAMTIASGGILAPGNSPGTLTVSGNAVWNGGGHYEWEINDWTGAQGTHWDFLNITGSLTISAAASPFIIDVVSLLASNSAGDVPNFAENSISTFAIATAAGGITGFESSLFTINTSGFSGSGNTDAGTWAIVRDSNTINLTYTGANYVPPSSAVAIPEPGSAGLFLVGLGMVALRRRRIIQQS